MQGYIGLAFEKFQGDFHSKAPNFERNINVIETAKKIRNKLGMLMQ